jgi:hypothetical protein
MMAMTFVLRLDQPGLALWLLTALLGLIAFYARGRLRVVIAVLGLVDLGFCLVYLVHASFFTLTALFEPGSLAERSLFALVATGTMIVSIGIGQALLGTKPPQAPSGLEVVLPVRRLHARRLLSALALLGILWPQYALAATYTWNSIIISRPERAWPVVGGAVAFTLYLLPLWDVLARGWRPERS